jgi:hypothetical protein
LSQSDHLFPTEVLYPDEEERDSYARTHGATRSVCHKGSGSALISLASGAFVELGIELDTRLSGSIVLQPFSVARHSALMRSERLRL